MDIKKELAQEEIFLKYVFLHAMHNQFKTGNPQMYTLYGGNACRQTSFLVAKYLSSKYPQMTFEVWEGRIRDYEVKAEYDHAWVLGTVKTAKKKEFLLIDLPMYTEQTFKWTSKHRFDNETKMEVLTKRRLNANRMGETVEFYTDMRGNDLYAEIMQDIKACV